MGRVWKVVLASVLFTALAAFTWHYMTLEEQHLYNTHESANVRQEIVKLTLYRDQLLAASTSPKKLPS